MYASIYRYAKDHGLSPLRNRTFRKPAAYICIDRDGDYERLDIVPKDNRTERKCPDIGKNRYASGKNTNIICEKKEYIFTSFMNVMVRSKNGHPGQYKKRGRERGDFRSYR